MKKLSILTAVFILFSLSFASSPPQSAHDLFQKALTKERAEGNLEEAIQLYEKVVQTAKDKALAAKAQLRIGFCYEKLGLREAQKAFQKVIDNYPNQSEAVKTAREKLALLLKAQAVIEKGRKEFKITKIHTEKRREGYFSPDGKKFALADYGNLWIRDISSGKEVHLVDDSSLILDLFWSPDSKTIAYVNLAWNVNVVSVKGGPSKTIIKIDPESEKAGNFIYPSGWTADGKKLVFRDSSKGLFAIPRDGGNWEEIYRFSSAEEAKKRINENMALSPDGKLVAYDSKRNNNTDIYIMPVGSKKSIRVTFDSASDSWPRWSYDGKWLAFSSKRSGDSRIWVVRISSDGKPAGKAIQVTREEADNGAWTHDGSISFMTSESTVHIFSANMDGSEEIQLTKLKGATYPRWSPDGKKIAFVRWDRLTGNKAIWTIPSKGGEEKRLTTGEFPVWSPDGEKIAFRSLDYGTLSKGGKAEPIGIWTIDSDGRNPKLIAQELDGWEIAWSNDGKYIIGSKHIEESEEHWLAGHNLFRITVKSGKLEELNVKGQMVDTSPDGKKVVYSRFAGFEKSFWLAENFLPKKK